jgi:hypothetical protein
MVVYRHVDGTLHQIVLDGGLSVTLADTQVLVRGVPVAANWVIGRDPSLLKAPDGLFCYYPDQLNQVQRLRWESGAEWSSDTAAIFAQPVYSLSQPGVVTSGAGLPFAHRMEIRQSDGLWDPFPNYRYWTNPDGEFSWVDSATGETRSFGAYTNNQWDADYFGATRLTLHNGVEVAATIGSYPSPLVAGDPVNDPDGYCDDCDCHLGTRPVAGGGRTACGHEDSYGGADLDACNCPQARSILFRPLADGVVNMTLEDLNDWILAASGLCMHLRPCSDCVPPGTFCVTSPPQSCVLPFD